MGQWPKVFIDGSVEYTNKKIALADAYSGWGMCHAGNLPPENFGIGMVCIGDYLGISTQIEELDKLKDQILRK